MTLFLIADSLGNEHLGMIFLLLLIPITYFTYRLVFADTRRDFGYLSTLCKLIMLLGVFSMVWA